MLNLYKREKPAGRLDARYVDPKAEYVRPIFPKNGENCRAQYCHNGFAFKLQPGTYFLMVNYSGFQNERKYMIRAVGEGLKLEMLE